MALRAKPPQTIEKRAKIFLYGPAKAGKTTFATQFPKAYFIDCEKGAENDDYVALLKKSQSDYIFINEYDELYREVLSLYTETHDYRTVIIDPLTTIYNELLDQSALRLQRATRDPDATGTEFGRHKMEPDRKIKRLLNLLTRLDMNVIITSHAKANWTKIGKELVQDGLTYDCYQKMEYVADLGLEVRKAPGGARSASVKYSRMAKEFPEDTEIAFSYKEIAARYGEHVLDRGAVAVTLATPEQVAEFKRLCDTIKYDEDLIAKGLSKLNANELSEMPSDAIQKWIDKIKTQLVEKGTVE